MSLNITPEVIEATARAIAKAADADYWTDEVNDWFALDESEKCEEEYPHMAFEDRDDYRSQARAALQAATPRTLRNIAERYRGKAKGLSELPGLDKTSFQMSIATLLDLADELDRDATDLAPVESTERG